MLEIIVTKSDGKKVTHSDVSNVEGIAGHLYLRDKSNTVVKSYGAGEWHSWQKVREYTDA